MWTSRLELPLSNVATLARTCTLTVPSGKASARPSTSLVVPRTSWSLCTTTYVRVPWRTSRSCCPAWVGAQRRRATRASTVHSFSEVRRSVPTRIHTGAGPEEPSSCALERGRLAFPLRLALRLHLLHAPLDQLTLQRAQAVDEKLAHQVIHLVLHAHRQQRIGRF